ncbi:MAG: hypothetical protein NTV00_00950 [Methylococcales bacterium]|nr:hypothetical protein [Methylococcales bacterium]
MNFLQRLSALVIFTLFSSITMAYQVTVTDGSGKPVYCPKPDSKTTDCWTNPPGTLLVNVKLDTGEKEELLDNVHVIIDHQGQFYQFQTQGEMWVPVAINGLMTSVPLKTSFRRPPWNLNSVFVEQQVPMEQYYTKGTKVYVGARTSDMAGFVEGSVKEAFVIQ